EDKFPEIILDGFIIMPNHLHGLIYITDMDLSSYTNDNSQTGEHTGSPLHKIIQWYKTMTTNEYIKNVKQ
ncbi:MAG: hypothetical protein Q8920_02890, partial [Bacillota bacterium]|nr:hypothetical protein [Bacillota bacterium]